MKTIALLTDFGLSDNFVGVIKGVILRINPRVRLVDISHAVTAHDIPQAAFLLKSSYRYFPEGTVFLVVVDPGVGAKRRPLIIRSRNYLFVGPDNGCLSPAAAKDGIKRIIAIENKRYFLQPLSHTFHGRDIFAPVAAQLARGKNLRLFGRPLKSIRQLELPQPEIRKNTLRGEIIYIDRFGNLVTNIEQSLFKRFTRDKRFKIRIKDSSIDNVVSSYQAAKPGAPLAVFGGFGNLEISLNQGSAEKSLRANRGLAVDIRII